MKVKCLTSIYPSKMINESNKYTKLIFTKNINCYTYIFFHFLEFETPGGRFY